MKNGKQVRAPWVAIALLAYSGSVSAYMIDDVYWGAADHGLGDVIGQTKQFQVFGANASLTGGVLTVDIYTNFAGLGDDKLYAAYTNKPASKLNGVNMGIGYGDLFLSNGWNPYVKPGNSTSGNTVHYKYDNNINGTHWIYGFALDNRWSQNGGSGKLYRLNGSANDANTLLTDDFISSATFRNGQEVAVDLNSSTVQDTGTTGVWSVHPGSGSTPGYLEFSFDIRGAGLTPNNLGLHWGPTCGNDVIEGKASVPEPGTFGLLGLGLMALAYRRHCRSG